MGLLRATRAGLLGRVGGGGGPFRYALTEQGWARLQYLSSRARGRGRAGPGPWRAGSPGGATMRIKRLYNGLYHCPDCLYEVELTGEASLKCEDCQGLLCEGPLPREVEEDEDDA